MPFSQGHALLIGVGSHEHIPQLDVPITVADVDAVTGVLKDERFCGYPPDQVEEVTYDDATRAGILAALDRLAERLKAGAGAGGAEKTALIYFCGHGEYGTDGNFYLVSHDAQIDAGRVVKGSGVSQAELLEKLHKIHAGRVLLIFNACHAGEIAPTLSLEATLGGKVPPQHTAELLLATGRGRVLITACREEQFSYIGGGKLTLFTQALVDGLRGKGLSPRGGMINAFDLYTYVYETVSEAVQEKFNRVQEPELNIVKGVGPFAVALYRGAPDTNLGVAEVAAEPPPGAVRQVKPEKIQRLQQELRLVIAGGAGAVAVGGNIQNSTIITGGVQVGGISNLQGGEINIAGGDIHRQVNTGGGTYIEGSVNTGGGAFIGRGLAGPFASSAAPSPANFFGLLEELRAGLDTAPLGSGDRQALQAELAGLEGEARAQQPRLAVIRSRLFTLQALLQEAVPAGAAAGLERSIQRGLELALQVFMR